MSTSSEKVWMISLGLAALAVGITVVWAQQPDRTEPDVVAKAYVSFLQHRQDNNAYELLTESERNQITLEEYIQMLGDIRATTETIAGCELSFMSADRAQAKVQLQPEGPYPIRSVSLELLRTSDGRWEISHGDYLLENIPRARRELVSKVLENYGEAWVKQDYAKMILTLSPQYLKANYGDPPYEGKLRAVCTSWESTYGPFEGISCTYKHVRYVSDSIAALPAKFVYYDAQYDKLHRFAPYLVTLQLDPVSKQWKIAEWQRTQTFQRPQESEALVTPERKRAEEEAIGGQ